jgi:hypothetical protein
MGKNGLVATYKKTKHAYSVLASSARLPCHAEKCPAILAHTDINTIHLIDSLHHSNDGISSSSHMVVRVAWT